MSGSNLLSYSGAFGMPADPENTLGTGAFGLPDYVPPPGSTAAPAPAIVAPVVTSTTSGPVTGPSGYAAGIGGHESGGIASAENPYFPVARGGPLGQHQFIASTWRSFADANPDLFRGMTPEQILQARTNPELSAKAADWYARQNAPVLEGAGIVATPANLGIAHALGPQGAVGVLKYPDATPLAQAFRETQPGLADKILEQNPTYARMTVGDLKGKYAAMNGGQYTPAPAPAPQPVAAAPLTAPLNRLSSLPTGANFAAMTPMQKLAYLQQLRSLFGTGHTQMAAAGGGGGQMVGGVNDAIPLQAGRSA